MKDRPRLIIDTDDDYTLRDFNGDVIVKRCRNLCASNAKIGGSLIASNAKIGGSLIAYDAEIGGDLNAFGAQISGSLYASRAKIGGSLLAYDAEIGGDLNAYGAKISRSLNAFGAQISGSLYASRAKIGGDLYASRAKIGGDLYAYDAEIRGVLIKPPTDAEVDRIREIIAIAETRPDEFSMREWHNGCGTAHCAYGWNQILCGEREDNSSALTFGEQTLPSIRHLIYTSEDVFLKNAKKILKRRAKGEIK